MILKVNLHLLTVDGGMTGLHENGRNKCELDLFHGVSWARTAGQPPANAIACRVDSALYQRPCWTNPSYPNLDEPTGLH